MKRLCITLCLILLVSMLAACSERVGNRNEGDALPGNNPPHNTADNPSGTNDVPHNTGNTPSGIATPNEHGVLSERLRMDLGNNIIIDAEVRTPSERNFSVRQVAPHSFNVAVRELLLGENYRVDESMPPVAGVSYHTNGTHIFMHDTEGIGEAIGLFPAENSVFAFLFAAELAESNLDFMSGDEAAKSVVDLLQSIGIAVLPTSIRSLDTAAIRTAVALAQSEFGIDLPDYTSFSESYIIEFTQVLNGVPVYSGQYAIELRAGTAMAAGIIGSRPTISAVVTEAGISNLSVSGLFDLVSAGQQATELISLEQAIETVRQSLSGIINVETLVINDIELVYAILPKSLQELNSFEAWPAWVFRTVQEFAGGGRGQGTSIQERAVFVCAVSGIILRDRFR